MDRYGIFIDVGYVIGAAAELLTGRADRHRVTCRYRELIAGLIAEAAKECTLPLLRAYWYDASLDGRPQHEQKEVAQVQGVRLRLGRLVHGQQKGVDSRIVRDLIVLARDRAIAEAFLVAGDEDLVEGVQEAQDQGVRVALLGVPGINQSPMLTQQADSHREIPEDFWRRHFRAVGGAAPDKQVPLPISPTQSPEGDTRGGRDATEFRPMPRGWVPTDEDIREALASLPELDDSDYIETMVTVESGLQQTAENSGRAFARLLIEESTPPEIERLIAQGAGRQVPPDTDRRLLRFADQRLEGKMWERPELKVTARRAFWDEIHGWQRDRSRGR